MIPYFALEFPQIAEIIGKQHTINARIGIIANIGALNIVAKKMTRTRTPINKATRTTVINNERLIT